MQSFKFLPPVLYTLFLWWFVTGLIIGVYGRSARVKRLFFIGATFTTFLALEGLILTRQQTQPSAVYLALTCGILIWGWHVAGYYLGYVTGPHSAEHLPKSLRETSDTQNTWFLRFQHALRASLYHELLIIGFIVLMAGLTWHAPNKWGLWIFLVLWVMHSLAKINVFFGVRNFRIEFLPVHLHYLDPLLSKRTNNLLLPLTIVSGSVVSLVYIYQGIIPSSTAAQTIGFLAIGTMIALGVLEHLLLILPVSAVLWGWGVKSLPQAEQSEADTTTIRKQQAALRAMSEQVVEG